MKRFVLFLIAVCLGSGVLWGQATSSSLGFKGKVLKVESVDNDYGPDWCGDFAFDASGMLEGMDYFYIPTVGRVRSVSIQRASASEISGTYESGTFKVKLSGGRVVSIVYNDEEDGTITLAYSYGSNGFPLKVAQTRVYYTEETVYGGGYTGMSRYQQSLQQLAQSNAGNLMQNYNNAVRAAQGVGYRTYAKTKKVKHTEKVTVEYDNYETDDIGNWVYRQICYNGSTYSQRRKIVYDSDFYSNFYWEKAQKAGIQEVIAYEADSRYLPAYRQKASRYVWNECRAEGDLDKVEAYASAEMHDEACRAEAAAYWNDRILETPKAQQKDADFLCRLCSHPFISAQNREKALDMARESVYEQEVMKSSDFRIVKGYCDKTIHGVKVFNAEYQRKIMARSNQLKSDSLKVLRTRARDQLAAGDASRALATCETIQGIDRNDPVLSEIRPEAAYQLLMQKKTYNTVRESDYEGYLRDYPDAPHAAEVRNLRALLAASLLQSTDNDAEMDRVDDLDMDEKTARTVHKLVQRQRYLKHRGKGYGIGMEFGLGLGAQYDVFGGLTVRAGHCADVVNFMTGFGIESLGPIKTEQSRLVRFGLYMPLALRFNVIRDWNEDLYIGAGTDLHFAPFGTEFKYDDIELVVKDSRLAKSFSLSPKFVIGLNTGFPDQEPFSFNFELFASYDLFPMFNQSYVDDCVLEDGRRLIDYIDPLNYGRQVTPTPGQRLRFGLIVRLEF